MSKKKEIERKKFIHKTIIDGLLTGLISIGVYLGRPPNPKPVDSYVLLGLLLVLIAGVIIFYTDKYKNQTLTLGLLVVLVTSIAEVILIGVMFQESIDSIIITILIVSPSVIIFDKILG